LDYLHKKELLLVVDSLEHLLTSVDLLAEILQKAPYVKILATSRERLNLRAEWLLDVPGLAYPADESPSGKADGEAIQLFLQHARRVSAGFAPSDESWPHIVRICQLLDGSPLGIELASPWVRLLPCERIAGEIQADLDFLSTSLRDASPRHQSLRAVFQHSWGLLSEGERAGAARLSVFCGPFRPEAAQAIAGVNPATILALTEKSFLNQNQSGRAYFHGILKQYASEALAVSPNAENPVRAAHSQYYAEFLSRRAGDLRGGRQTEAQAEIRAEIEDVRSAWDWAIEQRQNDILEQALEGLYLFYRGLGRFQEGLAAFSRAAAIQGLGEASPLLLAKLQARLADFHAWLSEYDAARDLARQSCMTFERQHALIEQAFVLDVLGRVAYWSGEYAAALQDLQSSVALYRQTGNVWGTAQALNDWANTLCSVQTDYSEAIPLYEESLALSRQIGDQAGIARALINLAAYEQAHQKNYAQARILYQEAATISQAIGNRQLLATALGNLGDVAYYCEAYEQALELLQDSLSIKRETGNRYSMLLTMNNLGKVNRQIGQLQEARRWYLQALQIACDLKSEVYIAVMLTSMAGLLVKEGETRQAAGLLQTALDHAGGDQDVINSAAKILAEAEAVSGAAMVAAGRQQGRGRRLEDVVAEVLAQRG
jgi:predicted ATPase